MQDVAARHLLNLIGVEGLNGKRAPVRGHELNLERFAIGVHLNDGADVASDETKGWQIPSQRSKVEVFQAC